MNQVQVEQKSYQMPPQDGITVAHFLIVADISNTVALTHCKPRPNVYPGVPSRSSRGWNGAATRVPTVNQILIY
jgi:hypothetical protein